MKTIRAKLILSLLVLLAAASPGAGHAAVPAHLQRYAPHHGLGLESNGVYGLVMVRADLMSNYVPGRTYKIDGMDMVYTGRSNGWIGDQGRRVYTLARFRAVNPPNFNTGSDYEITWEFEGKRIQQRVAKDDLARQLGEMTQRGYRHVSHRPASNMTRSSGSRGARSARAGRTTHTSAKRTPTTRRSGSSSRSSSRGGSRSSRSSSRSGGGGSHSGSGSRSSGSSHKSGGGFHDAPQ